MTKTILLLFCFFGYAGWVHGQGAGHGFRVRTITAGVTPAGLADTGSLLRAIHFLQGAKKEFVRKGYAVQTLRVATASLYTLMAGRSPDEALGNLKTWDDIAVRNGVILSIGQVLAPDQYQAGIADWAERL